MANLPNLVPHKALGKTVYSGNAKLNMQNKIPIWDDFDSLIEHAVRNQNAELYTDLNEYMRWALGIAALRENKQLVVDAEFGNLNELVADILETKGSPQSLYKLYEHLVEVLIAPPPKKYAHVSYCIDTALEKEKDKQAFNAAHFQHEEEAEYLKEDLC